MAEDRDTHKGFKATTILIIVGIVVLVAVLIYFIFGQGSILKVFFIFLEVLLLLSILFLMAYLFYYLFLKKQKFDVNYVNKKKLIEACTKIKRPILKTLYLSGDKTHTRAEVGTINGYCRIQTLTRNYIYDDIQDPKTGETHKKLRTIPNEKGEPIPQYTLEKIEQDVFTIKPKGLSGLFSDPLVIRVNPEDHDELVGDVTLYGFSLIPISEYWFLNSDHLDVRKIDYAILKEAERTVSFVVLSDMKQLIDNATGIDAKHIKGIEQKSLVDIPETRSVGQQSRYE